MAQQYTVQQGDTLSKIAERFYGNVEPANIQKLFDANRHVKGVGDTPDKLEFEVGPFHQGKGQPVVLTIPD